MRNCTEPSEWRPESTVASAPASSRPADAQSFPEFSGDFNAAHSSVESTSRRRRRRNPDRRIRGRAVCSRGPQSRRLQSSVAQRRHQRGSFIHSAVLQAAEPISTVDASQRQLRIRCTIAKSNAGRSGLDSRRRVHHGQRCRRCRAAGKAGASGSRQRILDGSHRRDQRPIPQVCGSDRLHHLGRAFPGLAGDEKAASTGNGKAA